CDGEHPRRLVEAVVGAPPGGLEAVAARAALRGWLDALQAVEPPVLGGEGDEWLEAAQAEATACAQAVALLDALDAPGEPVERAAIAQSAIVLAVLAQDVRRRSRRTTFGPRDSIRPVLSQHDDGSWRFHADSVQRGPNATDVVVAHTLARV